MDTSGRAILLAGATVVIALLGMFATGVAFMYGLAIAAVIAVLLTLVGLAHAAAGDPLALRPRGSCAAPRAGRRPFAPPPRAGGAGHGRPRDGGRRHAAALGVAALERDRDRRTRGRWRSSRWP